MKKVIWSMGIFSGVVFLFLLSLWLLNRPAEGEPVFIDPVGEFVQGPEIYLNSSMTIQWTEKNCTTCYHPNVVELDESRGRKDLGVKQAVCIQRENERQCTIAIDDREKSRLNQMYYQIQSRADDRVLASPIFQIDLEKNKIVSLRDTPSTREVRWFSWQVN